MALRIGGSLPRDNAVSAPESLSEVKQGGGQGTIPVVARTGRLGEFSTQEEAERQLATLRKRSKQGLYQLCWFDTHSSGAEPAVSLARPVLSSSLVPVSFFGIVSLIMAIATVTLCLNHMTSQGQEPCGACCGWLGGACACGVCGCCAPRRRGRSGSCCARMDCACLRCGDVVCCRLGTLDGVFIVTLPCSRFCCYRLGSACCLDGGTAGRCHAQRMALGCSGRRGEGNCALSSRCRLAGACCDVLCRNPRAPCLLGACCGGACNRCWRGVARCAGCLVDVDALGARQRHEQQRTRSRLEAPRQMESVDPWLADPATRAALQRAMELSLRESQEALGARSGAVAAGASGARRASQPLRQPSASLRVASRPRSASTATAPFSQANPALGLRALRASRPANRDGRLRRQLPAAARGSAAIVPPPPPRQLPPAAQQEGVPDASSAPHPPPPPPAEASREGRASRIPEPASTAQVVPPPPPAS